MECLMGIKFNNYALVAADSRIAMSIMTLKHDEDKIFKLSDKVLMGVCGEAGDTLNFAEYIQQNMQLCEIRNGYQLSPSATANFARKNLADALRSRVPYAIHGYGGFLTTTVLDKNYRPDMSVEEAYELIKKCVKEIQKRFIINLDRFVVKKVSSNGIEVLEPIECPAIS